MIPEICAQPSHKRSEFLGSDGGPKKPRATGALLELATKHTQSGGWRRMA